MMPSEVRTYKQRPRDEFIVDENSERNFPKKSSLAQRYKMKKNFQEPSSPFINSQKRSKPYKVKLFSSYVLFEKKKKNLLGKNSRLFVWPLLFDNATMAGPRDLHQAKKILIHSTS